MSGFLPYLDSLEFPALVELLDGDPVEPDLSPVVFYEEVALDLLRRGEAGRGAVLARLDDPNAARRAAAIASLSGEPSACSEVTEAAMTGLDDPDPLVVMTSVDALRHLGREDLLPRITALWTHDSPLIRGSVLRFVSRENGETSRAIMRAGLSDPEPLVRQSAADALADAGVVDAIAAVSALQRDPDPNVRIAAQTAVASLEAQASEPGK